MKESALYPIVEKWMKSRFQCFATAINKGLIFSRIDVVGVRDIGGESSGDIETISIEVKRGSEPFATASGQASGYKVYANRVYLADVRSNEFSRDEIDIASHLGIGLIQIRNKKCQEILTSPVYSPLKRLNLALLEKLGLAPCTFCGTYFSIQEKPRDATWTRIARGDLKNASRKEKGFIFWNRELDQRKRKSGLQLKNNEFTFERRFLCPECVQEFFEKTDP